MNNDMHRNRETQEAVSTVFLAIEEGLLREYADSTPHWFDLASQDNPETREYRLVKEIGFTFHIDADKLLQLARNEWEEIKEKQQKEGTWSGPAETHA